MVREKDVQNTDKAFVNAVRKTIGLSLILNGSNADKAKALERFSSELGIAKKTLENSGFALLEIAKYLENDEAAVKEYAGGMESAVKDAIDALEKKNNSGGSGSAGGSGSGSGSGSSGGRGNSSISVGNREPAGTPDPSTPPDTPEPNPPFCDLDGVLWAKDAILNLYQKKIISGKENGRFAPQDNLSREEAVKILVGAFGLFEKQEDLHFSDCNVEDWYYPYVSIAVKSGIVRGISETLFGTGTNINRQDFAVMLSRTLTAAGCKLNGAKAVSFADGEAISEYARADVDALSANGLFVGDESQRFYPQNSITRAEAAVAIERAVNFTESSQEVQP
ncbi:MAG: S-layer homology domain-containing protein, partial [Eubacteriales bacterium]